MQSDSIRYLCKKDKRLAKVISQIGPISYQPYENGYAFLVHEIIEQMLSISKKCKKWKPFSSIAARYLYRALDSGLTKTEFHLYK